MYPIVQSRFRAFNEPFEGAVPYMYLDIAGLVTVAVGDLIDPVELAAALPFRFKDKSGIANPGALASKDEIAAEWHRIKSDPVLAQQGHTACAPLTDLELDGEAISQLIAKRLAANETALKRQHAFKAFDSWPADAQLGLLSMAWALGPAGFDRFPSFTAACRRLDFKHAAAQSKIAETGNPGIIPRNRANFILFSNAAAAVAEGHDLAALHYPADLTQLTA